MSDCKSILDLERKSNSNKAGKNVKETDKSEIWKIAIISQKEGF